MSLGKRVLFRTLAVLLSLSPLLFLEAVARWSDWGRPHELSDPFVGFSEIRPLFLLDTETGQYATSQQREPLFCRDTFAQRKPSGGFRAFCLGGSTVHGRPFAIETAFSTWLKQSLAATDPDRSWEVVNCGGVSYASYRLLPILDEVLQYDPDLIVLYTGHNEFLEQRTYEEIREVPDWTAVPHNWLANLRIYNLARNWYTGFEPVPEWSQTSSLPVEVDAVLDYHEGLKDYHRDLKWRRNVVAHFESNLRLMVAKCRQAGVPVLLVNPVRNLKDTPPFKSQFQSETSADTRSRILQTLQTVQSDPDLRLNQRQARIENCVQWDPAYAHSHYLAGRVYLAQQNRVAAREAFLRAMDEDICPLRLLPSMRESIFQIAEDANVPCLDLQRYFDQRSEDGITGEKWLLDHVHPTIEGHQHIAAQMVQKMAAQGWLELSDGWERRRDQRYREVLAGLEPIYFETGKLRLEGLIRWTQGRSRKRRSIDQIPESSPASPDRTEQQDDAAIGIEK